MRCKKCVGGRRRRKDGKGEWDSTGELLEGVCGPTTLRGRLTQARLRVMLMILEPMAFRVSTVYRVVFILERGLLQLIIGVCTVGMIGVSTGRASSFVLETLVYAGANLLCLCACGICFTALALLVVQVYARTGRKSAPAVYLGRFGLLSMTFLRLTFEVLLLFLVVERIATMATNTTAATTVQRRLPLIVILLVGILSIPYYLLVDWFSLFMGALMFGQSPAGYRLDVSGHLFGGFLLSLLAATTLKEATKAFHETTVGFAKPIGMARAYYASLLLYGIFNFCSSAKLRLNRPTTILLVMVSALWISIGGTRLLVTLFPLDPTLRTTLTTFLYLFNMGVSVLCLFLLIRRHRRRLDETLMMIHAGSFFSEVAMKTKLSPEVLTARVLSLTHETALNGYLTLEDCFELERLCICYAQLLLHPIQSSKAAHPIQRRLTHFFLLLHLLRRLSRLNGRLRKAENDIPAIYAFSDVTMRQTSKILFQVEEALLNGLLSSLEKNNENFSQRLACAKEVQIVSTRTIRTPPLFTSPDTLRSTLQSVFEGFREENGGFKGAHLELGFEFVLYLIEGCFYERIGGCLTRCYDLTRIAIEEEKDDGEDKEDRAGFDLVVSAPINSSDGIDSITFNGAFNGYPLRRCPRLKRSEPFNMVICRDINSHLSRLLVESERCFGLTRRMSSLSRELSVAPMISLTTLENLFQACDGLGVAFATALECAHRLYRKYPESITALHALAWVHHELFALVWPLNQLGAQPMHEALSPSTLTLKGKENDVSTFLDRFVKATHPFRPSHEHGHDDSNVFYLRIPSTGDTVVLPPFLSRCHFVMKTNAESEDALFKDTQGYQRVQTVEPVTFGRDAQYHARELVRLYRDFRRGVVRRKRRFTPLSMLLLLLAGICVLFSIIIALFASKFLEDAQHVIATASKVTRSISGSVEQYLATVDAIRRRQADSSGTSTTFSLLPAEVAVLRRLASDSTVSMLSATLFEGLRSISRRARLLSSQTLLSFGIDKQLLVSLDSELPTTIRARSLLESPFRALSICFEDYLGEDGKTDCLLTVTERITSHLHGNLAIWPWGISFVQTSAFLVSQNALDRLTMLLVLLFSGMSALLFLSTVDYTLFNFKLTSIADLLFNLLALTGAHTEFRLSLAARLVHYYKVGRRLDVDLDDLLVIQQETQASSTKNIDFHPETSEGLGTSERTERAKIAMLRITSDDLKAQRRAVQGKKGHLRLLYMFPYRLRLQHDVQRLQRAQGVRKQWREIVIGFGVITLGICLFLLYLSCPPRGLTLPDTGLASSYAEVLGKSAADGFELVDPTSRLAWLRLNHRLVCSLLLNGFFIDIRASTVDSTRFDTCSMAAENPFLRPYDMSITLDLRDAQQRSVFLYILYLRHDSVSYYDDLLQAFAWVSARYTNVIERLVSTQKPLDNYHDGLLLPVRDKKDEEQSLASISASAFLSPLASLSAYLTEATTSNASYPVAASGLLFNRASACVRLRAGQTSLLLESSNQEQHALQWNGEWDALGSTASLSNSSKASFFLGVCGVLVLALVGIVLQRERKLKGWHLYTRIHIPFVDRGRFVAVSILIACLSILAVVFLVSAIVIFASEALQRRKTDAALDEAYGTVAEVVNINVRLLNYFTHYLLDLSAMRWDPAKSEFSYGCEDVYVALRTPLLLNTRFDIERDLYALLEPQYDTKTLRRRYTELRAAFLSQYVALSRLCRVNSTLDAAAYLDEAFQASNSTGAYGLYYESVVLSSDEGGGDSFTVLSYADLLQLTEQDVHAYLKRLSEANLVLVDRLLALSGELERGVDTLSVKTIVPGLRRRESIETRHRTGRTSVLSCLCVIIVLFLAAVLLGYARNDVFLFKALKAASSSSSLFLTLFITLTALVGFGVLVLLFELSLRTLTPSSLSALNQQLLSGALWALQTRLIPASEAVEARLLFQRLSAMLQTASLAKGLANEIDEPQLYVSLCTVIERLQSSIRTLDQLTTSLGQRFTLDKIDVGAGDNDYFGLGTLLNGSASKLLEPLQFQPERQPLLKRLVPFSVATWFFFLVATLFLVLVETPVIATIGTLIRSVSLQEGGERYRVIYDGLLSAYGDLLRL
ncbi:putative membrane spanning protein [Giardia muris]|uniref:Putative membrane spanning protein n=1 Tax=Giardia muris TaxID=5742 RepID=A0A4Z1STR7_GIAMU|nr:putative membrane spanning protein [Giardia muris]|eukprot:TNJ29306.1 putative membrane spanning protein [Giardia muris]